MIQKASRIKFTEEELKLIRKDLRKSEEDAEKRRKRAEDSKKRIQNLKDNPIKREGDDLINSISDKLKN